MFGYTAEPGSPTEERLRLLGSLAVTADEKAKTADEQAAGR
jgi:hypothetical protein